MAQKVNPFKLVDKRGLKQIYLFRNVYHPNGTFGVLAYEYPFAFTAERPWLQNEKNKSCVPAKEYECIIQDHVKRDGSSYKSPMLLNVPNRTDIEIHIGNDPMIDSTGCILPGLQTVEGKVAMSTIAFQRLMDIVGKDERFILVIIDCIGFEKAWPTEKHALLRFLRPKALASKVPDVVIRKVAGVPQMADFKAGFKTKMENFWWKTEPVVVKLLKLGGAVVAPFQPIIGGAIYASGELVDMIDGEPVKIDAEEKGRFQKFIDALIAVIEAFTKKKEKSK